MSIIINIDNTSTTILLIDVNINNEKILPTIEEIIILKMLIFLFNNIPTDIVMMASIIALNKKNKSPRLIGDLFSHKPKSSVKLFYN